MLQALLFDVCCFFCWFVYFCLSCSQSAPGVCTSSPAPTLRPVNFVFEIPQLLPRQHGCSTSSPLGFSVPPESQPPDIRDVWSRGSPRVRCQYFCFFLLWLTRPHELLLKSPAGVDCLPVYRLVVWVALGIFFPLSFGFSFRHFCWSQINHYVTETE